jgi:hypothetical protein
MTERKAYIGDGVYADVENGMIKLTTENGISATNTIFLELPVVHSLAAYLRRIGVRLGGDDEQ